ncbi:MAG: carbohydrate-binding family 9-like protein [Acidobacteria bacterium]|nr:carbohydrate-binding family 9-like protein [Acidobacteriota bacterium]
MMRIAAVVWSAGCLCAQNLPRYDVYRTVTPIIIDARLDEPEWRAAPSVGDFHFNWWQQGEKEQTAARILWDDENLYVGFHCIDRNISADVLMRHGPVSLDDSVEVFLSPNVAKPRNYYGFEINAIGTMLNFLRADWYKGPFFWEPDGVRHRTTYHGWPAKRDSRDDTFWVLELAIPWKNFAKDAPHTPPHDGDTWRLNLNRAGGVTNAQYSTWSPVSTPKPSFHVPEAFGTVRFVKRMLGK